MTKKLSRGPASTRRLRRGGYTLVELIVSVGLFALVMTLATGGYLVMLGVNRETQNTSIGIDNLAFALETMTRTIRTGTRYTCPGGVPGAPNSCSGATSFQVTNSSGAVITYSLGSSSSGSGVIRQQNGSAGTSDLTDPTVNITSLVFYVYGTARKSAGDSEQPRVVILLSGTVSSGAGKMATSFAVETEATMRGTDL